MDKSTIRSLAKVMLLLVVVGVLFTTAGRAQKSSITEKPKNPLVGRWKSELAVIDIRDDGTISINDAEYVYKVKGGVITVSSDEGSLLFPYELDGDTLTVQYQGQDVVYQRIKSKLGNGTAIGNSPTAAPNEGVLPGLVGKWCYLRNMTGTNSYSSSRCFVLNANGTYEYSGESSSSGNNGSTAGQSYDTGRWTATRTTLTAYSSAHGKIVYPIVLRNHPKTGDPMIVVDGDAYVTFYQKNPW